MSIGAFFNYTVEDGLVAVLRGFRYSLEPIFAAIPVAAITGKLTVGGPATSGFGVLLSGGADVPGFANFQLGQYQADYQPCYVLAGSGMTISLILTFSGAYAALTPSTVNVEFYGNNLLATGRPVNYEPGFSDPLPVYDRTEYQQRREKKLISTTSLIKNKATTAFSPISTPSLEALPREQYRGPRPPSRPAATARPIPVFHAPSQKPIERFNKGLKRNRWR